MKMDFDAIYERLIVDHPNPAYVKEVKINLYNLFIFYPFQHPKGKSVRYWTGHLLKTALLRCMGFSTCAIDDYGDPWHLYSKASLLEFAKKYDIKLQVGNILQRELIWPEKFFDVAICTDVIEHLHGTPRFLLAIIGMMLK